MDLFLLNILNGLQLSLMTFLLAVGLTMIFGLMDTLNLAHGGFYTLGAYSGWLVADWTGNFWFALVLAPLLIGVVGFGFQRYILQNLATDRSTHLDFALLTFGLLFVIMGGIEFAFGGDFKSIELPAILSGGVEMLGLEFPLYRLFIIFLGLLIALVLWLIIDRTVLGALVRASVGRADMVQSTGINTNILFAGVFSLGTGLAALAGVVAAPVFGIHSRMGASILVISFIVVVIGGLGNLKGSFFAAIFVGMVDTMAQAYLPGSEVFAIYVIMMAAMIFKPEGLFSASKQGSS